MTATVPSETVAAVAEQLDLERDPTTPNFELDQYFTPVSVAAEFVEWAGLFRGIRVLEPSAGTGNLCKACMGKAWGAQITAVEIDPEKAEFVADRFEHSISYDEQRSTRTGRSASIVCANFLDIPIPDENQSLPYELALMNPPYSTEDGIDARMVERATRHADRVCAIVRSVFFNGELRKKLCHDRVKYSRVKFLTTRPRFGGPHGAKADFMFIECTRQDGISPAEQHSITMEIG